jgi:hypothetical protein
MNEPEIPDDERRECIQKLSGSQPTEETGGRFLWFDDGSDLRHFYDDQRNIWTCQKVWMLNLSPNHVANDHNKRQFTILHDGLHAILVHPRCGLGYKRILVIG